MSRKLNDGQDRLNFTMALLSYLADPDRKEDVVTVADLVERFQVSKAEVSKALSTLTVAGFTQVWSSSDASVHYYFAMPVNDDEEDFEYHDDSEVDFSMDADAGVTESPRLSSSQVSALIAGLQYLASLPELALAPRIEALIQKLAKGHQGQLVTDIEYRPGTVAASIQLLRTAIIDQKRIRCEYTNQKGETKVREMDPVRMDLRSSNSQLRSWCHENNEGRSFRIDHIRNIEILEDAWCKEATELQQIDEADYISKDTDVEVIIEVDPEAYSLIDMFFGETIGFDKKTMVKRARLNIGFLPNFGRHVARYGGAARIIEPQAARDLVREFAREALMTQNLRNE